jgi:chromosome segregation ATPase
MMEATPSEARETQLLGAQRALADTERAWREECAQLATPGAEHGRLTRELQRLDGVIRQADDRATIREAQERRTAVERQQAEVAKDMAAQELVIAKREARVRAARQAVEDVHTRAAVLRGHLREDEAQVRQLQRDIERAEHDLDTWRRGLAELQRRMAATTRQLRELGI